MGRAPTLSLLFAFTLGIAALPPSASAAPRQGDDGPADRELGSPVLSRTTVALAARRVAIADPDLDGIVSRSEARKYFETRFTLMDRNRDGRVSEAEFSRTGMSRSLQTLETAFEARPLSFEAVDVDGNGALTPEEFLRADVARRTWAGGAAGDPGRGSIFGAADANADGALSKQELLEAGDGSYAGSDANGDGRVTIWEFYGGTRF
jgi:EF hand